MFVMENDYVGNLSLSLWTVIQMGGGSKNKLQNESYYHMLIGMVIV